MTHRPDRRLVLTRLGQAALIVGGSSAVAVETSTRDPPLPRRPW